MSLFQRSRETTIKRPQLEQSLQLEDDSRAPAVLAADEKQAPICVTVIWVFTTKALKWFSTRT